MVARHVALLPIILALASCTVAARVRVSGTPDAPVIMLEVEGGGAPAIRSLSIGTAGTPGTVWSIHAERCTELSYLVYGQVPAGFREDAPAPHLVTRRNYDVYLAGCGATGGARFAIVGDEIVSTHG